MAHPRLRTPSGVTLMEVMVAVVIVAVSFLPIIGVLGTSMKATGNEDSINRAMNLCQEKLNSSLQFPFDFFTLHLGAPIDTPISAPGASLILGTEAIEGVTYTSTLTVADRPGSFRVPVRDLTRGNPDDPKTWTFSTTVVNYTNLVHTYTLRVSWKNRGEQESRFYTLTTFRAKLSNQ
ncbi:MAG TPA: prepilin-type N-terminal cleavage/methylation domain-containing protein [Candidatus Ozemobacteraceae bacterium]|nr:prepilin-type N-terminal cleavage/methylation domain-containing protein [Candidatus Ozemobacteraceae bacterium]